MIFRNARLILPEGIRDGLALAVEGGKIAAIGPEKSEGVDLQGNLLAPGFIDLHVHGARGFDTMDAEPKAFREICAYHASGGTTSLLLTTATAPLPQISETLAAIRAAMPQMKQIIGAHVEGPFISHERAGAQRKEFICEPTAEAIDELLQFRDVMKRITLAPEVPGALAAIERFQASGVSVSGGHSDAADAEAARAFERGMRQVTHTFNCMSSLRKRDGERVAGLLEFALSEPEILCELIADGHHVSTTLMRMLYRAKRADGICLITDATAGAGLPNESKFSLGGLDCVVENGACWLADRSALAGSAARMIDLIRTMVHVVGVPLHEAIVMASTNPARALKAQRKGVLKEGADADLVVLSPELKVRQVFLAGAQIFPL